MKRSKYTEEKKGAKERFDRAMGSIFQAPKQTGTKAEKQQKGAASRRKRKDGGG
jgi:hypothetical protein